MIDRKKLRVLAERVIRGETTWDFSPRSAIELLDELDRADERIAATYAAHYKALERQDMLAGIP